jgi:hypothetical protein
VSRLGVAFLLVCLGSVAVGIPSAPAADDPPGATAFELTISPPGGDPRRATAWERDGTLFLSAGDLALLLQAVKYWRSDLGRLTLVKGRREAAVMDGSSLALLDGDRILHLSGPAFLWGGRMWIPLDLVVDDDGEPRDWVEAAIRFSREDRTLGGGEAAPSLVEASLTRDLTGWRLALTTPDAVRAVRERSDRTRFVVRLPGVQYDPLLYPLPSEHAGFQDLRLRNLPEGLEISFTPAPQAKGYRLESVAPHGVEIVLGTDERDLRSGALRAFAEEQEWERPPRVRRVLLQAGDDGGEDEARLAREICERAGGNLGRTLRLEARLVPPGERVSGEEGDVFLVLHVHPRPGGPTAFVETEGSGRRGGAPVLESMGFASADGARGTLARSSRLLAQSVVDAVAARLGLEPRSVTAVHVPELSGLVVPAALIELGGGTSGWNDESKDRAAMGIVEGVRLYVAEQEDEW